jgi:hypothetical protein
MLDAANMGLDRSFHFFGRNRRSIRRLRLANFLRILAFT